MELAPVEVERLRLAALRYAAAAQPCPLHFKRNCCAMGRASFDSDALRAAEKELEAAALLLHPPTS